MLRGGVVGYSLPALRIATLSVAPGDTLIFATDGIGGSFRKLTRSFVGTETIRTVERFFVDRAVFSVKGIESHGLLTDPDGLEADVKRAMIGRARTSVLLAHGLSWADGRTAGASLDHAMWFHRSFRADRWLLYAQDSPVAYGARGLAHGQVFTADGKLVVSVMQEGLIRTAPAIS